MEENSENRNWGGARKGAGRKKENRTRLLLTVDPETAAKLKAESDRSGVPISRIIDGWAKELLQ